MRKRSSSKPGKGVRDGAGAPGTAARDVHHLEQILDCIADAVFVKDEQHRLVLVNDAECRLAGALSMAIGTWVSVRSQRQVNDGIRRRTDLLFTVSPRRAQAELTRKLVDSGMPVELTQEIADKLSSNKEAMIGLLTEKTSSNEIRSALFTGAAYLVGLLFPVLPYFFAHNSFVALILSVLFAGIALATVASIITLTAGSNAFRRKIREMVITGIGAAALSYGFGRLIETLFRLRLG